MKLGKKLKRKTYKRATEWGVKKFDKWCEKRKIKVDLNGLECNSAKVLRGSENRARPSINSKCIDWN